MNVKDLVRVIPPVTRPMSVGGFAELLGVPRQRIYNLVKKGFVRVEPMTGGLLIQPAEANRVLDAVVFVTTPKGVRVRFDWI